MPNAQARASERAYIIRLAKPADLPQVVALDAQITGLPKPEYWADLLEHYARLPADEADLNSPRRNRFFLCAADSDQVLGFIIGEVRAWEFGSPPCGWVFAIGICADARGGHIAQTLFEAICERFRKAGVNKVRTMLARDDTLVMSFFRSQGMMAGPFIQLEKDL